MKLPEVKVFGSTEATLILGIVVFVFGVFLIVASKKKLPWPASGLMPV